MGTAIRSGIVMDVERTRAGASFPSTHWTKVYLASDREGDEGSKALADLLKSYRPALRQYLRSRFRAATTEDLDDWVSSFIEKKILEGTLLKEAHRDKGHFRGLLTKALYHFAEDQRRKDNRQQRKPSGGLVPFEEAHEKTVPHSGNSHPNPGDVRWARTVIERARKRTENFYRKKGRASTWEVFLEGFYLPMHDGMDRPTDEELARRHGFESPREASNTIINAKRRFGSFLREVVREYEASEANVDGEIRDLIAIVSDGN